MAELNRTYRGKMGSTDVLAFPMTEGRFPAMSSWPRGQAEGPDLLGDVVISAETAARQARDRGRDVQGELALLLVHGILHLVGYDHGTTGARRRMWQKQRSILEACGLRPEAGGARRPTGRKV
jgi:probable rRNA maturation factor